MKALLIVVFLALSPLFGADIKLSWTDNSSNEAGFAVERAPGAAGGTFAEIGRVATNVATYTDPAQAEGSTFRYRVMAFNSAGNSAYSNVITVTIPVTVPAAPTNITVQILPSAAGRIQQPPPQK